MNLSYMATTGLSPISHRDMTSFAWKSKRNVKSIWIQRLAVSNTMKKHEKEEVNPYLRCKELKEERRKSLKEYCEGTKDLIRSDGGPPRWFSPLECGSHSDDSPLLLFLPGIDGVGLGLISQHQRLGKIFDVWCLHIPAMDRTTFTDLVMLVEKTVRSEYNRLPNRPIYLVGESLGGCLALSAAASNPHVDLVLILADPATSFKQSLLQPLISLLEAMPDQLYVIVPCLLSSMLGDPLKMVMDIMVKELPPQQIFAGLSQDFNAMSSYLSVFTDIFPRETLLWKLQMLNSASAFVNSQLHIVKAQTLILSSGRDQLLPGLVEGERLRHTLSNCEIRSVHGSGHFLFLEDGVDLVSIIKGAYFYRRGKYLNYVSDYMPMTPSEFNKVDATNRRTEVITSPVMLSTLKDGKIVRGLAGIPSEGPVLVVGYHMFMGIEVFPMLCQFLVERNINLRGIAHPMMFKNSRGGIFPVISLYDNFRMTGAVPASASNCCKLLSSKSHVLLYPGGMRESLHRKSEEYKLFWPEKSEFVRMAARFGAKIIPFGVVGEDDVGEIFFDYNDQMKIPLLKSLIESFTNEVATLRTDANGEVANQDLHLPGFLLNIPVGFIFILGNQLKQKGGWRN